MGGRRGGGGWEGKEEGGGRRGEGKEGREGGVSPPIRGSAGGQEWKPSHPTSLCPQVELAILCQCVLIWKTYRKSRLLVSQLGKPRGLSGPLPQLSLATPQLFALVTLDLI